MDIDKKAIYISLLLIIFSCIGMYTNQEVDEELFLNISLGIFTSSLVTLSIFAIQFFQKRDVFLKKNYLKIQSLYQTVDFVIDLLFNINRTIKNKEDEYSIINTSVPYIDKNFIEVSIERLKDTSSRGLENDLNDKFSSFWFDKANQENTNFIRNISSLVNETNQLFTKLLFYLLDYESKLIKRKIEITKKCGFCDSFKKNNCTGPDGKDIKEKIENELYEILNSLRIKLEKINTEIDKKASSLIRIAGYADSTKSWEDMRKIIHKENKKHTEQILFNIRKRREKDD